MKFVQLSLLAAAVALAGCSSPSPVLGGKNISYGDSKAVELVTNEFGSCLLYTSPSPRDRG